MGMGESLSPFFFFTKSPLNTTYNVDKPPSGGNSQRIFQFNFHSGISRDCRKFNFTNSMTTPGINPTQLEGDSS